MKRKGFIYFAPRVLSILFLVFLSLFSLDVITPEASFWEIVVGLFMHNIPVLILSVLLYFSWKRPMIGAWTFFAAGILYALSILTAIIRNGFEWHYLAWIVQITGVCFLVGWMWGRNRSLIRK